MQSFWNSFSLDTLEKIYDVAIIVLIISAILVPISTFITWQVTKKINEIKNSSGDIIKQRLDEAEIKLTPRTISKQQKEQLVSFLADKPKLKLKLFNAGNNEESSLYSEQIFKLLIDAGFKNIGGVTVAVAAPIPQNISVGVHPDNSSVANFLSDAFNLINIKHNIKMSTGIPEDQINIIIGAKGL